MIPLQLVLARPASGFEGPIAWEAIQATLEASARRLVQAGALLQIVPPGADPARLASALLTQGAARHEAGFVRLIVGSGPLGAAAASSVPIPTWSARVRFEASATAAPDSPATPATQADWHIPAEVGPRPLTESDRLQILANTLGFLADLARSDDARPALTTAFEALAAHGTLLVSQARLPLRAHRDALVKRYAGAIARRWRDDLRLQNHTYTNDSSDALPALGAPPVSIDAALAPVAHTLGERFAAAPATTAAEVHAAAVTDVRRLGQAALASLAAWCDDLRRAVDHALEAQNLAALAPLRRALAARMDALAPALATPTAPAGPAGPAPFAPLPSRAALDAAEAALAACPAPIPGLVPLDLAWATGGATLAALALGPAVPDLRILSQVPGEGWTVVGLGAALLGLSATVGVRALSGRRRRRAVRHLDRAQNAYRAMWIDDLTDHTRVLAHDVEARLTALARRALEAEHDHVAAALQAIQQTATELANEPPWPRAEARAFDRTLALDTLRDLALPSVADVPPPALGEGGWREHLAACTAPALEASARRVIGDGPLLADRRDLVDRLLPAVRDGFAALTDQLQRWVPAGAPARRLWASPASIADAAPAGALQSAGEIYLAVYWPQLGEEPHDA